MEFNTLCLILSIAAVVLCAVFFAAGILYRKKVAEKQIGSAEEEAKRIINEAIKGGENKKREMLLEAKEEIHKSRSEYEREVKERRAEVSKQERRLQQKEEALDKKINLHEKKEDELAKKIAAIDKKQEEVDSLKRSQMEVLEKIYHVLEEGKCARTVELTEDERACLSDTPLLTMKPVIYVANVSEDYAATEPNDLESYRLLKAYAESEHSEVIPICCQIEAEIAELGAEEKAMFLSDLGIEESGLDRLIKASYSLLGLISFLTAGPDECRAWTIRKGTKAPKAAGKIHSDIERGFIRAEVLAFEDLKKYGSMSAARDAGVLRSEGKEYVMQDGDIVLFRFNV